MADDPTLPFDELPPRRRRTLPDARSPHTVAGYAREQAAFAAWCARYDLCALPADPKTVAKHLRELAVTAPFFGPKQRTRAVVRSTGEQASGYALSSIRRRAYGIADAHKQGQYPDPTRTAIVRQVFCDLVTLGRRIAPDGPLPLDGVEDILKVLRAMDVQPAAGRAEALRRKRDRAILLLLYSGALHKEEVRTLRRTSVRPFAGGVQLIVTPSVDGDRTRSVDILEGTSPATDPVWTLMDYLGDAGIESGCAFPTIYDSLFTSTAPMSRASLARMVAGRLRDAGFDPNAVTLLSFRKAAIYQVGQSGGSLQEARRLARVKNGTHVLAAYDAGKFRREHPGRLLGL